MTTKTQPADLQHAEWCKAERIETTEHKSSEVTITRCIDCGQQRATNPDGKVIPEPTVTGGLSTQRRGSAWEVSMERAHPGDIPGVTRR